MLEHGVLIVVADGSRAHFYRNSGTAQSPHLEVVSGFEQKNPASHLQGRDAPGTGFASAGGVRSHVSESNGHEKAEHKFARSVVATLGDIANSHKSSNIILIAPPHMLGELRHDMPHGLKSRVTKEVDKDLTKHAPHEIAQFLLASH